MKHFAQAWIENWDSYLTCLALNSYFSGIFCFPGKTRTGFAVGGKLIFAWHLSAGELLKGGHEQPSQRRHKQEKWRDLILSNAHSLLGGEWSRPKGMLSCWTTQQGKTREDLDDRELIHGLHSLCGVVCWSKNMVHITSFWVLCGWTGRRTLALAPLKTLL